MSNKEKRRKEQKMEFSVFEEYAQKLKELLPLARRAYGSRSVDSPQHDASREYTRLVVEYYRRGGSLINLAQALGVTYAGLRRRVITAEISAPKKRNYSRASQEQSVEAFNRIMRVKELGTVEAYHEALRHEYEDNGISLTKIAKLMGLSSANPLYYGVARTKMRER
jgi:chromosome segregation and condensation protein ScpB